MVLEITAEELALILDRREKEARTTFANEKLDEIKELIIEINELGFDVRLPVIGGEYVRRHCPIVKADEVSLTMK